MIWIEDRGGISYRHSYFLPKDWEGEKQSESRLALHPSPMQCPHAGLGPADSKWSRVKMFGAKNGFATQTKMRGGA